MIPIYFPFTHMSLETFDTIMAFFPRVVVYQASTETVPESMKNLAADDRIEIRTPITSDEKAFKRLIKEYHTRVDKVTIAFMFWVHEKRYRASG